MIGREPERLTYQEQLTLDGKWIALEIYTPETLPLRHIAAVGDSAVECMRELAAKGMDARRFEFRPFRRSFR